MLTKIFDIVTMCTETRRNRQKHSRSIFVCLISLSLATPGKIDSYQEYLLFLPHSFVDNKDKNKVAAGIFNATLGDCTGTAGIYTATLGTFSATPGIFSATAGTFGATPGVYTASAGADILPPGLNIPAKRQNYNKIRRLTMSAYPKLSATLIGESGVGFNNAKTVSVLINSIYYFIDLVLIMTLKEGYRLVAINGRNLLTDNTYKTVRGARMAFLRRYGNQACKYDVKANWSRFYLPYPGWCDKKMRGKKPLGKAAA